MNEARTNQEKRAAVLAMLQDKNWSQLTQAKIAMMCGVSAGFVSLIACQLRAEHPEALRPVRMVERNGVIYRQAVPMRIMEPIHHRLLYG